MLVQIKSGLKLSCKYPRRVFITLDTQYPAQKSHFGPGYSVSHPKKVILALDTEYPAPKRSLWPWILSIRLQKGHFDLVY